MVRHQVHGDHAAGATREEDRDDEKHADKEAGHVQAGRQEGNDGKTYPRRKAVTFIVLHHAKMQPSEETGEKDPPKLLEVARLDALEEKITVELVSQAGPRIGDGTSGKDNGDDAEAGGVVPEQDSFFRPIRLHDVVRVVAQVADQVLVVAFGKGGAPLLNAVIMDKGSASLASADVDQFSLGFQANPAFVFWMYIVHLFFFYASIKKNDDGSLFRRSAVRNLYWNTLRLRNVREKIGRLL